MTPADPRQPSDIEALLRDREELRDTTLPDSMLDTLFAEVAASTLDARPGPRERVRQQATWARVALLLCGTVGMGAAALAAQGPRPDLADLWGPGAAALLVLVVVASHASRGAVAGLHRPAAGTALAVVALAALLAPALTLLLPGLWPGTGMPEGDTMRVHRACFAGSALVATACAVLAMALQRFDRPPSARVLLGAGAGGIAGFVVQQLHCPVAAPLHVLVAHALAGLTVGGVVVAAIRMGRAMETP